jgi:hypothetical protein
MILKEINCQEMAFGGKKKEGGITEFKPVYYYTASIVKEGDHYCLHQKPFDMSTYYPFVPPKLNSSLVVVLFRFVI